MREPQAFRRRVDAPHRKPALPLGRDKTPLLCRGILHPPIRPHPNPPAAVILSKAKNPVLGGKTFRFAQDGKWQFRNSLNPKRPY